MTLKNSLTAATAFPAPRKIGLCFPEHFSEAEEICTGVNNWLGQYAVSAWTLPLPQSFSETFREKLSSSIEETDLLICVGGDGTVLKAFELVSSRNIPVLGIRLGRLGFLAEVIESEIQQTLREVMENRSLLFERNLIDGLVVGHGASFSALNDIVIGRDSIGSTISILAEIDGTLVAEYRADAVIIATATGSTGYSLSAGGPVLHPSERSILMTPVAPHLTRSNSLIVLPQSEIKLTLVRGNESGALLSFDGIRQHHLNNGDSIMVKSSDRVAKFVTTNGGHDFYSKVAKRLGWLRADYVSVHDNPNEPN
ncbi:MAG TPA: NAD(+)/NADH kinase [Dehalococcoidia bacterium]|jgi:NAD+ kinase|nr:NAD(+)/NADH kinase [Dehalococcoidia bacterium]